MFDGWFVPFVDMPRRREPPALCVVVRGGRLDVIIPADGVIPKGARMITPTNIGVIPSA